MNNTLDLLLQMDEAKLKKPTKEVEIKRLSQLAGGKVVFLCEALTMDQYAAIQDDAVTIDVKKQDADIDMNEIKIFTVIAGVKEPQFKSKELQKKYKVLNSKELVKKLLLPGEIHDIYSTISELSGFGDDAVEEVKNSQGQTDLQK